MCGDARSHAYHPSDPLLPLHESGFGPFHDDSAFPSSAEPASHDNTIHQPCDFAQGAPEQQQQRQQQPASNRQQEVPALHQHGSLAPYHQTLLQPQSHTPYQSFGHAPLLSQSFQAFVRREREAYASRQQSLNYIFHLQPMTRAPQHQQMAITPHRDAAYPHQPPNAYAPPHPVQTGGGSMMSEQGLWRASPPVNTHFNSGPHPRYAPPAPAQQEAHNLGLPLQTSLFANPRAAVEQYGPQVRASPTSAQLREPQDYGPYCHPTHLSSTQDASMYHHPLLASSNQANSPSSQQHRTLPPASTAASSSSSQQKATTSNRRQLTHSDIYKLNGEMRSQGAVLRAMKRVMAQPRRRRNFFAGIRAMEEQTGRGYHEITGIGWPPQPTASSSLSMPGQMVVKKEEKGWGEGLGLAERMFEAQASGAQEEGDALWWSLKTEK